MNDKWISVVIPVFNAEDYLQECLDSIIHQTIGLEKIEVIIVDDASTDRSLQCIMEYEQQYPEDILVVALKKNNGQADARNIGMEYISAPYFAFLDADDWMEPDGYEKLIRMAIRYQCDIVQCSSISHLGKARPMFQKTVSEPVYYKIDNIEERRRFIRWWNSPGTSGSVSIVQSGLKKITLNLRDLKSMRIIIGVVYYRTILIHTVPYQIIFFIIEGMNRQILYLEMT